MQARRGLLAGVAAALIGLTAVVWFLARDSADGSGQLRRPDDLAAAHAALDEAVPQALQSARVPGAAVALVADGRVASTAGYGVVTTDGAAVDENTVFQVGSVSKPVAAAVIARLAGSGDIDLDRPVGDLVSSWAFPSDTPDPDAVTLRSLLSHTAGLNVGGYLGIPDDQALPSLRASLAGDSSSIDGEAVAQTRRPGTYAYSGGGYTIAELAVADAIGSDWGELADRVLFEPLGMTSTGYGCTSTDAAEPADAMGHDLSGAPTPRYRYVEHAAAGLCSTAADLGAFAAWLASDDPAAEMMRTPVAGTDGAYGLGLHLDGEGDDLVAGHEGVNRGFVSDLRVVPESDFGIVVLTNGDGGGDVIRSALAALG